MAAINELLRNTLIATTSQEYLKELQTWQYTLPTGFCQDLVVGSQRNVRLIVQRFVLGNDAEFNDKALLDDPVLVR